MTETKSVKPKVKGSTSLLAADIGGTFTDVIWVDGGGRLHAKKVLTTPSDYRDAILKAIEALSAETGEKAESIARFIHGTTIATNTIISREGGRVALVTTKGFRDVLEIARIRTPRLYDIRWEKPAPLAPRNLRFEVSERIAADGAVVTDMDQGDVDRITKLLEELAPEAIAVCLINSFMNPVHEEALGRVLSKRFGSAKVTLSSELQPELGEYERMSTTVANAYLRPVVGQYLQDLQTALEERRMVCPLLILQSNGGTMTLHAASEAPIHIVESGPAGGVIAAATWSKRLGLTQCITLDMGGTTAKTALIRDGSPSFVHELELRPGITVPSRLFGGGGYVVRSPAIDIAEVGAGGGSIAYVDSGGALQVGPASAGSVPGPVCYGLGGKEPTVTDANVALGFLDQDQLLDRDMPIDAEGARRVIEEQIARPLSISLQHAAFGIHTVANARMIRAIKNVTTERGVDPRGMCMFVFGGSGPVHAAAMARSLGISRVVVPPLPGLFSSFGLLLAKITGYYLSPLRSRLETKAMPLVRTVIKQLHDRASRDFGRYRVPLERTLFEVSLALRYVGQRYTLDVPLADDVDDSSAAAALAKAFHAEHEKKYGRHESDHPVEIVTVRLRGIVSDEEIDIGRTWSAIQSVTRAGRRASRRAFFGPDHGTVETPVIGRADLVERVEGPLIVEDYGSTILVPPDASVALDEFGDVVIELKGVVK